MLVSFILVLVSPLPTPNGLFYLRWAGVDFVWEQRNLEAKKLLENAADSPASNTRFVSPLASGRVGVIRLTISE